MFIFTIADVFVIICLGFMLLSFVYITVKQSIKESMCSHTEGVIETSNCDAICKSCSKNLGFIGSEENKLRRMNK